MNLILHKYLLKSQVSVKVYPSPVIDFINIEIALADTGRVTLEMYNYKGVMALSEITDIQSVIQIRSVTSIMEFYKIIT